MQRHVDHVVSADIASPPSGPLLCVVGARPNYMKMAPLLRAFARRCHDCPAAVLVHTGQHYDFALNDRLFADLELPAPDVNLEVGSGSHAVQTAEVMKRFEPVVLQHAASCVIVVGDVNSTLACTLVAAKLGVPVVHVEAGLRSFDRAMPEEINRLVTDQIADLLYTTERIGACQPGARRHRAGTHALRRQPDDRFAACSAEEGRTARSHAGSRGRRRRMRSERRLRCRHDAPPVQRRRAAEPRGAARHPAAA